MANWTTFTQKSQSRSEPVATLQANGILALNSSAYEALGKAAHIEFLYQEDERIMGLRAVEEDVPHGYRLRPQSSGGGATASARAFVSYWKIPHDTSHRYAASLEGDVLAIDLKKELPARATRAK